ncbi:MAG: pyridoxal-phosphate dependent enzyme [Planctomycetes bacterium]|nr:pyridoxal-phosphate dependent enzyme [Planctomycetota bacterium]
MAEYIDFALVRAAHERIRSHIHRTPVITCAALDRRVDARLFFKCENLQKAGAFKSRGACNAVFSLSDEEARRGVATHSSGNHAAALARAAALRGVPAHIVMPANSRRIKIDAVREYGGQVTLCEPTLAAREETAARVMRETGAVLIHPYDDERIIAGQATATVELLEQVPDLDVIIAPVGGGGLLSGTLIAAKHLRPIARVLAAEPQLADDAYRGWRAGHFVPAERTDTIADGLRTSLGRLTFPIIMDLVDDILLASEEAIVEATRMLLQRAKTVVEASAAVPLAALLENEADLHGRRVGIILSGGNLDLDDLPWK